MPIALRLKYQLDPGNVYIRPTPGDSRHSKGSEVGAASKETTTTTMAEGGGAKHINPAGRPKMEPEPMTTPPSSVESVMAMMMTTLKDLTLSRSAMEETLRWEREEVEFRRAAADEKLRMERAESEQRLLLQTEQRKLESKEREVAMQVEIDWRRSENREEWRKKDKQREEERDTRNAQYFQQCDFYVLLHEHTA